MHTARQSGHRMPCCALRVSSYVKRRGRHRDHRERHGGNFSGSHASYRTKEHRVRDYPAREVQAMTARRASVVHAIEILRRPRRTRRVWNNWPMAGSSGRSSTRAKSVCLRVSMRRDPQSSTFATGGPHNGKSPNFVQLPKNSREVIRVALGSFRGHKLVHVRAWAIKEGDIKVAQLDALIDPIQKARTTAAAS